MLFGHSTGAALAFGVAARPEREGGALTAMSASGRRAPASVVDEQVHRATDAQLITHVKKLSGSGAAALDDPDIVSMVPPAFRSDYRAAQTYRYRPGTRLNRPLYPVPGRPHGVGGPSGFHVTGTLRDWSVESRPPDIEAPTLLISGRHDEATPVTVQPHQELIPNVRRELFQESSHHPHPEEPELFRGVMTDFLKNLCEAGPGALRDQGVP